MKSVEEQLAGLAEKAQQCRRCPLHRGRSHVVYGEGPPTAAALFIGEAPGRAEDEGGRPFIGRTGRFFEQKLEDCGLKREDFYITSAVKCRPPDNRDPRPDELAACRRAWLEQQVELVDPPLILLLGKSAVRQMLGWKGGLKELRGRFHSREGRRLLITCHPTAAMRFPAMREGFEEDLQRLAGSLERRKSGSR